MLYYKVLSLLALLKLSRQAFNERLREEQEALAALTQRASQQAATAAGGVCGSEKEELKELVKAATFSGYRLAELKRERGTQYACFTGPKVQLLTHIWRADEKVNKGKMSELSAQYACFTALLAQKYIY